MLRIKMLNSASLYVVVFSGMLQTAMVLIMLLLHFII